MSHSTPYWPELPHKARMTRSANRSVVSEGNANGLSRGDVRTEASDPVIGSGPDDQVRCDRVCDGLDLVIRKLQLFGFQQNACVNVFELNLAKRRRHGCCGPTEPLEHSLQGFRDFFRK